MLEKRVPSLVLGALHLNKMPPEALVRWQKFARRDDEYEHAVTIAIVGKYTGLTDSYLSVIRGLSHSAMNTDRRLVLKWVESSMLEPEVKLSHPDKHEAAWAAIKECDGILIPGGFGDRGVRGKIAACRYAREHKVPFFGICLGLQVRE